MYIILFIFLVPLLRAVAAQQSACVKWGNTFDVSLESANIIRNCNLPDGRKICCSAVNNSTASRGVGASYVPPKRPSNLSPNSQKARVSCVVEKQYMSSPQELRELAEADRIERIPGDKSLYMIEDRYHALMEYVTSDEFIRNSTLWLNRVKVHMSGVGTGEGEAEIGNSIDREFLSRFEFTRTCTSHGPAGERAADATTVTKWTEWIEPVGITARHPFGFATCRQSQQYYNTGGSRNKNGKAKPRVGRSNVDYVLLQSGAGLHRQTHTSSGRRIRGKDKEQLLQAQAPSKHYLFDAGTSTFDSSLFWFTCAFSQVLHLTPTV